MAPERDIEGLKQQIPEVQKVLEEGLDKVYRDRKRYYIGAVLCLLVLFLSTDLVLPFGLNFVLAIYRTAGTLLAGYALIHGIVLSNIELNGLISTKKDLEKLLEGQDLLRS